MGYRHIMVSDTLVPRGEKLPDWFTDKWKCVNFDAVDYWASNTEFKMYGIWIGFVTDVQQVIKEMRWPEYRSVQLVFIADERMYGVPDIIHYEIYHNRVIETHPLGWRSHDWNEEDISLDKEGYPQ